MYRIYDHYKETWIKDNVYLSPNDIVFISKKSLFGSEKLYLASDIDNRYTYHQDIGLEDVNQRLIFVGDICKIDHLGVTGVIAYASEHASYYLLDNVGMKYFPLSEEFCKYIEVIGNVIDNKDLLPTAEVDHVQIVCKETDDNGEHSDLP